MSWLSPFLRCFAEVVGRENGVPNGIRTRVAAVRGLCPRPLDDGDRGQACYSLLNFLIKSKTIRFEKKKNGKEQIFPVFGALLIIE